MTEPPDDGTPEDWIAVLEALNKGDREAHVKVAAVITGWLAHYRAYELRDSWPDLVNEVLIQLMKSHRAHAIREPSAFIRFTGTITRNMFLDWIHRENRQRELPERLEQSPDFGEDLQHVALRFEHLLNAPGNLGGVSKVQGDVKAGMSHVSRALYDRVPAPHPRSGLRSGPWLSTQFFRRSSSSTESTDITDSGASVSFLLSHSDSKSSP